MNVCIWMVCVYMHINLEIIEYIRSYFTNITKNIIVLLLYLVFNTF